MSDGVFEHVTIFPPLKEVEDEKEIENEKLDDLTSLKEFDTYFKKVVKEAIHSKSEDVIREDAKEIAEFLKEEMDVIISKRVKEHFVEIAKFIIDKFEEKKVE
jgi:hypothetical protein